MKINKVLADLPTINTPIMNPYLKRNVLINRGFPNHSKYWRGWEFKKTLRRFRSRARYHMKC